MLKKFLFWIVCFVLSILVAAAGFFSATQGEIFFAMHMIIYGIAVLCMIICIALEESAFAKKEGKKNIIIAIVAIAIELALTWVITLFGVDFYTAYMIFSLIGCLI